MIGRAGMFRVQSMGEVEDPGDYIDVLLEAETPRDAAAMAVRACWSREGHTEMETRVRVRRYDSDEWCSYTVAAELRVDCRARLVQP